MEIITSSTKETAKLASEIAKDIKPGDILALHGDLGSGKTTFTSYLVDALGLDVRVQSPSFVIIRRYCDNNNKNSDINTVYHIDLYRLTKKEELEDLGLDEMFEEENSLVIIEWPEIAKEILPERTKNIHFRYIDYDKRSIDV